MASEPISLAGKEIGSSRRVRLGCSEHQRSTDSLWRVPFPCQKQATGVDVRVSMFLVGLSWPIRPDHVGATSHSIITEGRV